MVGNLIKELREARGWSQGRLADALCDASQHSTVTREEVSRWERGKRTPRPFWLRHLATVLEVPFAVLEFERLRRRIFLTDVAATAIAPFVASDLIAHGFEAALRSSAPKLDDWQSHLVGYGVDYMTMGAAEIQRRLSGDLVILQQQLESPGMWDVSAKLMVLYGKTFPGSDGAKAVNWYRTAAIAADRSGNDDARVWVRGRAGLALGYEGASLGMAKLFADQATAISDKPTNGLLNAVWAQAHIAALLGDDVKALHLMEDAKRLFEKAGSEESSDYAIPWWRHNVHISLLAARLGDEKTAIKAQDDSRVAIPANLPRFHTHLEMHRGLMLARSGDKTGGIAYAQTALDALPPEKHSLTLRLLMEEIKA